MIIADNIDTLYKQIIHEILLNGEDVMARGLKFKEIYFQTLKLSNPRARLIQNQERKLSKKFAMAEFIWIMSGQCNLEMISFYNKNIKAFSDDGISLHGAYGPRLRHWKLQYMDMDQLESCLQRLKKDIYTRQASIVILDPALDFAEETKDVPCNNYLQFLYRNGKLNLLTYVRSNDVFLGLPYDIFEWTMLQEIIARALGVELGEYYHVVGSLHIYEKDISRMTKIASTEVNHIQMTNMPVFTDLSIINSLNKFEKSYREEKVFLNIFDEWWGDKVMWLIR